MAKYKRSPASALLCGNPAEPIGFSYGVVFGRNQELPFGGVPDEWVMPESNSEAELWVITPSEFSEKLFVVVVDERCALRESFMSWIRHATTVPPDEAPFARIFVPERAAGSGVAGQRVRTMIDFEGYNAEVVSYVPPIVFVSSD